MKSKSVKSPKKKTKTMVKPTAPSTQTTEQKVSIILGATLSLPDGGGITLQNLAFSQESSKTTKEEIVTSYRKYCDYLEEVLLNQWEQNAR